MAQKVMYEKFGNDFLINFVSKGFLAAHCPQDLAEEYCQKVQVNIYFIFIFVSFLNSFCNQFFFLKVINELFIYLFIIRAMIWSHWSHSTNHLSKIWEYNKMEALFSDSIAWKLIIKKWFMCIMCYYWCSNFVLKRFLPVNNIYLALFHFHYIEVKLKKKKNCKFLFSLSLI